VNNILNQIDVFSQYVSATGYLLKNLEDVDENLRPNKIYPIAYLFRHSLELGIKLLIYQFSGKYQTGHDVVALRERLVAIINDSGGDITLVMNEQQRISAEVALGTSELIHGQTIQEWIDRFNNFNLSTFLELSDKYFDNDPQNTRFRYSEYDVTYQHKADRYKEILNDVNLLRDLSVFLHIIMLGAIVNLKEHETHRN